MDKLKFIRRNYEEASNINEQKKEKGENDFLILDRRAFLPKPGEEDTEEQLNIAEFTYKAEDYGLSPEDTYKAVGFINRLNLYLVSQKSGKIAFIDKEKIKKVDWNSDIASFYAHEYTWEKTDEILSSAEEYYIEEEGYAKMLFKRATVAELFPELFPVFLENLTPVVCTQIINELVYSINQVLSKLGSPYGVARVTLADKNFWKTISDQELQKVLWFAYSDWENFSAVARKKAITYHGILNRMIKNIFCPEISGCVSVTLFGTASFKKEPIPKSVLYQNESNSLIAIWDREIRKMAEKQSTRLDQGNTAEACIASAAKTDREGVMKASTENTTEHELGIYMRDIKKSVEQNIQQMCDMLKKQYADVARGIDDVGSLIIEHDASIHEDLRGVKRSLDDLQERLCDIEGKIKETISEDDAISFTYLLEKRIADIREITKAYSNVVINERICFVFSFIKASETTELIKQLLDEICSEKYKKDYNTCTKQGAVIVYSFESAAGQCILYKKNGKVHIADVQIREEHLLNEALDFFTKQKITITPNIYFDSGIFEAAERLLKSARQSVHMVFPWVFEDKLSRLTGYCNKNVSITLRYGYLSQSYNGQSQTDLDNQKKFIASVAAVHKFADSCRSPFTFIEDDTHVKAVIIDGKVLLTGSCNLLSYFYDYEKNPEHRHEVMVEIHDEELCKAMIEYIESDTAITEDKIREIKSHQGIQG